MDLFFKPQSVAFIGISARTGVLAFNALENLLACGYEGRVYPVNPNADEILGLKAYPDVKSLPEPVDLAVISTRRSLVPEIVKECVENGIKAIIVVGQGFSDANDDEGRRLEEEIVRIARAGGARILGPNTIGVTNPFFQFHNIVREAVACRAAAHRAGMPERDFLRELLRRTAVAGEGD